MSSPQETPPCPNCGHPDECRNQQRGEQYTAMGRRLEHALALNPYRTNASPGGPR